MHIRVLSLQEKVEKVSFIIKVRSVNLSPVLYCAGVVLGQKYEFAKKWRIHIITSQWVKDSVSEGKYILLAYPIKCPKDAHTCI